MLIVPALAMSVELTLNRNSALLLNVGVRVSRLTRTSDPERKFDPFTVSVKLPLPTFTVSGVILAIRGIGLRFFTSNICPFEAIPFGLMTCTLSLAIRATSEAGI
jgi:hypothetical protein